MRSQCLYCPELCCTSLLTPPPPRVCSQFLFEHLNSISQLRSIKNFVTKLSFFIFLFLFYSFLRQVLSRQSWWPVILYVAHNDDKFMVLWPQMPVWLSPLFYYTSYFLHKTETNSSKAHPTVSCQGRILSMIS